MAENINKAPLYEAGSTYFLSHKHGLPAKIYIEAVYKKAMSKEWMYCIYSEANNCKQPTYIPESVLSSRISKHSSRVYKLPEIERRIEDGYRFCGNEKLENATKKGKEFASNSNICSVMLHPAVDSNGNPIPDVYGIWIKWNCVITGKGVNESSIRIK